MGTVDTEKGVSMVEPAVPVARLLARWAAGVAGVVLALISTTGRVVVAEASACAQAAGMAAPQATAVAQQRGWRMSAQCLWPAWPAGAAAPPGAAVATGSVSSTRLSTPLASLKVSVSGMVLSLGRVAFRSISITW